MVLIITGNPCICARVTGLVPEHPGGTLQGHINLIR